MKYWLALLAGLIVLTGCGTSGGALTPPNAAPATYQEPPANPQSVLIPSLGVESTLIPTGLDLENRVNTDFPASQAAWYEFSVLAGEVGPLVLLGHVDGEGQPGIFNRLKELRPGDSVFVPASDGRSYEYTIDRVEEHPKDPAYFPTESVYGPVPNAQIRLITCGGPFGTDRAGHYDNNIIAFGTLRSG